MAAPAPGGIRFGNYVLLRRIARGGMAEVFLAQQRGLEGFDRRVAVKRILPHLVDAPDFVKMFLGEAKLAAALSHPNIVHIYDFGRHDGDYFIAMEFVDGVHAGDLFRIAEKEKVPPALVARIGADAATALHHAHELRSNDGQVLGLVHRDVSPANIMVSYDGTVKLCDFGIAKAAALGEQLTNPGQVKGKYAYMSPEQTVAAPLDGRSDVFSLGIVLWELLVGRTIVGRVDAVESMRAIRDGNLPPIQQAAPRTPTPLAKALTWAMQTDREKRATPLQLANALEAFIKSSPDLATPLHLGMWIRARFPRQLEVGSALPADLVARAAAASPPKRPSATQIQEGTVKGDVTPMPPVDGLPESTDDILQEPLRNSLRDTADLRDHLGVHGEIFTPPDSLERATDPTTDPRKLRDTLERHDPPTNRDSLAGTAPRMRHSDDAFDAAATVSVSNEAPPMYLGDGAADPFASEKETAVDDPRRARDWRGGVEPETAAHATLPVRTPTRGAAPPPRSAAPAPASRPPGRAPSQPSSAPPSPPASASPRPPTPRSPTLPPPVPTSVQPTARSVTPNRGAAQVPLRADINPLTGIAHLAPSTPASREDAPTDPVPPHKQHPFTFDGTSSEETVERNPESVEMVPNFPASAEAALRPRAGSITDGVPQQRAPSTADRSGKSGGRVMTPNPDDRSGGARVPPGTDVSRRGTTPDDRGGRVGAPLPGPRREDRSAGNRVPPGTDAGSGRVTTPNPEDRVVVRVPPGTDAGVRRATINPMPLPPRPPDAPQFDPAHPFVGDQSGELVVAPSRPMPAEITAAQADLAPRAVVSSVSGRPLTNAASSSAGIPNAGMPHAGTASAGMFGSATPNTGMPSAGMFGSATPNAGMPNAGMFGSATPNTYSSNAGMSGSAMPNAGISNPGTPGSAMPNAGISNPGTPGSAMPNAGMPGSSSNDAISSLSSAPLSNPGLANPALSNPGLFNTGPSSYSPSAERLQLQPSRRTVAIGGFIALAVISFTIAIAVRSCHDGGTTNGAATNGSGSAVGSGSANGAGSAASAPKPRPTVEPIKPPTVEPIIE